MVEVLRVRGWVGDGYLVLSASVLVIFVSLPDVGVVVRCWGLVEGWWAPGRMHA